MTTQQNWNAIHYQPDDNSTIDKYARIHSMQDVWYKLKNLFPIIQEHWLGTFEARRYGHIAGLIEHDDRFAAIRDPMGPKNKEEWVLLAQAVMEAMYGVQLTEQELYEQKSFGPYDPYKLHNQRVQQQIENRCSNKEK
jgi:hypothetical protein